MTLVAYASRRGGTAEMAQWIGDQLVRRGHPVSVARAADVHSLEDVDAVVLGSCVYLSRWDRRALRFAARFEGELRARPLWLFSTGPLDDSAARGEASAPTKADALALRLRAREHVVLGGRLEADARGLAARALARSMSGDWRDADVVRAFADRIADELDQLAAVSGRVPWSDMRPVDAAQGPEPEEQRSLQGDARPGGEAVAQRAAQALVDG